MRDCPSFWTAKVSKREFMFLVRSWMLSWTLKMSRWEHGSSREGRRKAAVFYQNDLKCNSVGKRIEKEDPIGDFTWCIRVRVNFLILQKQEFLSSLIRWIYSSKNMWKWLEITSINHGFPHFLMDRLKFLFHGFRMSLQYCKGRWYGIDSVSYWTRLNVL